ncbi:hypothetical protein [Serratia fonticola]
MTFQTFHSLTSALIHTMAKQELLALNWPTSLHLEYGQQWGQSDGVVFHGTLSSADLLRIIPGLRGKRYLSRCNALALARAACVTREASPRSSPVHVKISAFSPDFRLRCGLRAHPCFPR